MPSPITPFSTGFFLAVSLTVASSLASAATVDHTVGPNPQTGAPVVLRNVTPSTVGELAEASGTPMGLELIPGAVLLPRPGPGLTLTGMTLEQALQAIITVEPRYEWREFDGVIVIRPANLWSATGHPLDGPVGPVLAKGIQARDALDFVAELLGNFPRAGSSMMSDSVRFTLDAPAGTVQELLNAIVRTHGKLAWTLFWSVGAQRASVPYFVELLAGSGGQGIGINATDSNRRSDLSRFAGVMASTDGAPVPLLERVIGLDRQGLRLSLASPVEVRKLGAVLETPTGLEWGPVSSQNRPAIVTGLTLREALDRLVQLDPRYEWRELDGVIVVRPVAAWSDASHPLAAIVEGIQFEDATTGRVVSEVARRLGAVSATVILPDTLPISLNVPPGSALDLLNAVAHAHGSLGWEWKRTDPNDATERGMSYSLTWLLSGGLGAGVYIPSETVARSP